jgi:hypothetical protein
MAENVPSTQISHGVRTPEQCAPDIKRSVKNHEENRVGRSHRTTKLELKELGDRNDLCLQVERDKDKSCDQKSEDRIDFKICLRKAEGIGSPDYGKKVARMNVSGNGGGGNAIPGQRSPADKVILHTRVRSSCPGPDRHKHDYGEVSDDDQKVDTHATFCSPVDSNFW